ncbi:MAG TPA: hypothetical protein VM364_02045 [Vicinamibacterales bacterium]|nr:hypothetical protein [Vicinamibacterales bacterium]
MTRRRLTWLPLAAALMACGSGADRAPHERSAGAPAAGSAPASTSPAAASAAATFPLRTEGTRFITAAGTPFEWRGITAFRLAEMIAGGRESDAVAYLDWARTEQLTVVRVLLMAKHLFELSPQAGRAALPRLLELAKARGLAVEAVAFADTKEYAFDLEAHVREIGRIADEHGNAFVEIANEPGHPTQDDRLHDPAFVQRLAALLPERLVVALGSIEYAEGYGGGDYITMHPDRGSAPWDHVLALADAALRWTPLQKPVVSDEPIGAAQQFEAGRRDNEPARFAAAAALTALAGMGATFHYEGGLQARIPQGREAACLAAWQLGLALVRDARPGGAFVTGEQIAGIARVSGARAVFARTAERRAVILLVDPQKPAVQWGDGWAEERRSGVPGMLLITAAAKP